MHTVEVEFVGGPVDGQRTVLPLNCGYPPTDYQVLQQPNLREVFDSIDADGTGMVEPVRLSYTRQPSHRDDGPLWLYVYDGAQ